MRFQEYHIQQNEALAAKAGLLGQPRQTRALCSDFVSSASVRWAGTHFGFSTVKLHVQQLRREFQVLFGKWKP